jgi:hypothetical protein
VKQFAAASAALARARTALAALPADAAEELADRLEVEADVALRACGALAAAVEKAAAPASRPTRRPDPAANWGAYLVELFAEP